MYKPKQTIAITPGTIVFITFFLLSLYFVFYVRAVVTLLFLSFLIMVALNPIVTFLNKNLRFPRMLAALVVYLITLSGIGLLIALVVPPLTSEVYLLIKNVSLPAEIQTELNNFRFNLTNITNVIDRLGSSAGVVFSLITSTFSGVFTLFTLIVVSFYLMLERYNLYKKIYWLTDNKHYHQLAEDFVNALELRLGGWVRGQLVLMLVIGTVTYVGLRLLNIPYALPLAVLAGLLEIVPNVGPTLASIPAIIVAYLVFGPVVAGLVTLFYVLVQQLENNLIVPKIMKDSANVNPLVAIVIILVGITVGGVVGALLSVPIYIVLRTIYSFWIKERGSKPLA